MSFKTSTALIAVDVQAGFEPGGNLPVPDGNAVVAPLIDAMGEAGLVVFSRDWHPPNHCSFKAYGGVWPEHCVAGTPDAELDPAVVEAAPTALIVNKGTDPHREAYSAFDGAEKDSGTPLAELLRSRAITRLLVGGLATDYCVKATVLDALRERFKVIVLTDAVRAVNASDGERALSDMASAGATLVGHSRDDTRR
jgi:nicotinamidase/pyrazinamidase